MTRLLKSALLAAILSAITASAAPVEPLDGVVVTYFHRTLRCQTCLMIEGLSEFTVSQELAEELAAGTVTWRVVDFEQEANAHEVDIFSLVAPSLIIAEYAADRPVRWRNLDRMWELAGDPDAFDVYVLAGVRKYLAAPAE